jgi:hypothetical protein
MYLPSLTIKLHESLDSTNAIQRHQDPPLVTKKATGAERPNPTIFAQSRWQENMPWV